MFKKSNSFNGKSRKKRSMKQNRRKVRKHKALRDSENMNKLRRCISNTEPSQIIDIDNLNLEALANLTDYQLKYLKMMHKNGHMTTQAVTCIQEYVKNFPAEIMDDLIQVSDDDDNQDPEDCNDRSDVDSDIERDINDADNNDIDVGNDTHK